jgi:molybdopterin biosynthesis enzyme
MEDAEKLTRDTIKNGGVLAMLYFDIHAKTKENVEELGTGFINSVIHRPGVVFAYGEIDNPVDGGPGKNWSSSISIKVLVKSFVTLGNLCIAHSPYTVEILRPDEIKLQLAEAHDLLGNMSAATAEYKRYIMTKLATPEELAGIENALKQRAEMGQKMLKEGKKERKEGA